MKIKLYKKYLFPFDTLRVKWTDDKLINLIKCLQEFKSSMVSEIATQTLTNSNYRKV